MFLGGNQRGHEKWWWLVSTFKKCWTTVKPNSKLRGHKKNRMHLGRFASENKDISCNRIAEYASLTSGNRRGAGMTGRSL